MKLKLFLLAAIAALAFSCAKEYDDTELRDRIENLEAWQTQVNANIATLQTIVGALEAKDYVASVAPLSDGSGYVINFSKSGAVTIKHGTDGATPIVGTAKDEADGCFYWTIGGEWLSSEDGGKLPVSGKDGADAIAPQMRINEASNYWETSTDGGKTWQSSGVKATGPQGATGSSGKDGDSMFSDVKSDDTTVTLTLTNGTEITLPKHIAFTIGDPADRNSMILMPKTVTLPLNNLPEGFTAIVAKVHRSNDAGTDILTKAGEATEWSAKINTEEENSETSYSVTVTAPDGLETEERAILEVTVIGTDGAPTTSMRAFHHGGAAKIGYNYYKSGAWSSSKEFATEANPIMGVVFSVNADKKSGKVVSLDELPADWNGNENEVSRIWWSTEKVDIIGADSEDNGLANMRDVWTHNNAYTNYPALAWVHEKNTDAGIDTKDYADGIKGVWYLPAKDELSTLQGKKVTINTAIDGAGTSLSNIYYWSSSEFNDGQTWEIHFGDGTMSEGNKANLAKVRAILAF